MGAFSNHFFPIYCTNSPTNIFEIEQYVPLNVIFQCQHRPQTWQSCLSLFLLFPCLVFTKSQVLNVRVGRSCASLLQQVLQTIHIYFSLCSQQPISKVSELFICKVCSNCVIEVDCGSVLIYSNTLLPNRMERICPS